MQDLVTIANTILVGLQIGGAVGLVWSFIKAGYKCFGEKQHFSEAKGDILRGLVGFALVLGAFKLSDWIQTMVKF